MFVVEVVESLDLSEFVVASRTSRERGRPAYHPEVMVGIVLYASMTAVTSSRRIERALSTDVGFRVVAANERPDHVTICRFISRHGAGLRDVFAQVVGLAAEAGLVDVGVVAVDGTKMPGSASQARNRKLEELREQFGAWADEVGANDAADDAAEAADPDAGPIPEMTDRDSMREWIRRKLAERAGDDGDRRINYQTSACGFTRSNRTRSRISCEPMSSQRMSMSGRSASNACSSSVSWSRPWGE